MGIISNPNDQVRYLPGRGLNSTLQNKPVKSQQPGNPGADASQYKPGDKLGVATVLATDPLQGVRVRMPDGSEKTVPANANPKLIPYIQNDGKLDLAGAVKGGVTDPAEYNGWNVSRAKIEQVKVSVNTPAPAAEAPVISPRLAPYVKSGNQLDLVAAVKAGVTDPKDYEGWNVDQGKIDAARDVVIENQKQAELVARNFTISHKLLPYKTGDNTYDVMAAIKGGVDESTMEALGVTKAEYTQYKEAIASSSQPDAEPSPPTDAEPSLPTTKSLPEGVTTEQLSALKSQLSAVNKEMALLSEQHSQFNMGAPENIQFEKLLADRTALESTIEGLTDPNRNFEEPPTGKEIDDLLTGTDPMISKYLIVNPYYRPTQQEIDQGTAALRGIKGFDLTKAVGDGVAESKLTNLGFTTEDIKLANAMITVEKAIPGGITSYETMTTALKNGVTEAELTTLGYTNNDIKVANAIIAVNKVLPDGIQNDAGLSIAHQVGLDSELKTLGFTDDDLNRVDSWQLLEKKGYVDSVGNLDIARAQADGLDAQILTSGFTQAQLKEARDWNATHTLVNGEWYLTSDLEEQKAQLEKFGKYIDKDGKLDLSAAVLAGHWKAEEYKGWDVSQSDIKAVLQNMADNSVNMANYTAGLAATGRQLVTAEQQQTALKELDKYKLDVQTIEQRKSGLQTGMEPSPTIAYDLVQAIKDGKQPEKLKQIFPTGVDAAVAFVATEKKLEPYKQGEGYDLANYLRDNPKDAPALLDAGFDAKVVDAAVERAKLPPNYESYLRLYLKKQGMSNDQVDLTISERKNAQESATYQYLDLALGKKTDPKIAERAKVLDVGIKEYVDKYGGKSMAQSVVAKGASQVVSAGRAIAPDVTLKDISGEEWVLSGAQAALWVTPFTGKVGAALTPLAVGIVARDQAKNWDKMSTGAKVLAVGTDILMLTPALGAAASKVKFASVKVPLKGGEVTVYKGLSVFDRPVIGKSGGKLIVGGKEIVYPKAADIEIGYEPVSKLETKIMASRNAMKKMGITDETIARVEGTLTTENMFVGKKSPYLNSDGTIPKGVQKQQIVDLIAESYELKSVPVKKLGTFESLEKGAAGLYNRELGIIKVPDKLVKLGSSEIENVTHELIHGNFDGYMGLSPKLKAQLDFLISKSAKVNTEAVLKYSEWLGAEGTMAEKTNFMGVQFWEEMAVEKIFQRLTGRFDPAYTKFNYDKLVEMFGDDVANNLKRIADATPDTFGIKPGPGLDDLVSALKSNPLAKGILAPEPVKTMDVKSVSAVIDESVKAGSKVKEIYGSTTIKSQIAPELRNWRTPNDMDIQTNMNIEDTTAFAQKILKRLEATKGKANVRIRAEKPTLIEVKVDGEWHHAVDIHSVEVVPGSETSLEGAYGHMFDDPTVKVKYPGIGEVNIMSLSESGKRKVQGILRWQEGEIRPYAGDRPGIANRLKDVGDYYVILRTFKGQAIADEWARLWGYEPKDLLAAQVKDPLTVTSWSLKPSIAARTGLKAVPSVSVIIPDDYPKPKGASLEEYNAIKKAAAQSSPMAGGISPSTLSSPSLAAVSPSMSMVSPSLSLKSSYTTKFSPSVSSAQVASPAASPELSPPGKSPVSVGTSHAGTPSKALSPLTAASPSARVSGSAKVYQSAATRYASASVSPKTKAVSLSPMTGSPSSKVSPKTLSTAVSPSPVIRSPKTSPMARSSPASPPYKSPGSPKPVSPPKAPRSGSSPTTYPYPPPSHPVRSTGPSKRPKLEDSSEERKNRLEPGDLAWRQGAFWYHIIPHKHGNVEHYEKIVTRKPPEFAETLKRLPQETYIDRGNLPKDLVMSMGFENVKIMPNGMPNLKFLRRGRRRK